MTQDGRGGIWFGTTGGVYRYDGSTFTNIQDADSAATGELRRVPSIFEDKEGTDRMALLQYDGKAFTVFPSESIPANVPLE